MSTASETLVKMTITAWLEDGARRFGPNKLKWKFVCSGCGHVQAVEDFRSHNERGATAESAHSVCIGRFAGLRRTWLGGEGPGPCDYTSGGLFDIRPVTLTEDDGAGILGKCFAFADSEVGS